MRRIFRLFLFMSMVSIVACNAESDVTAPAQDAAEFRNGIDYDMLPTPVATADPSKVEVAEIFWYGCIHCYHLEPLLEEWLPTLGDGIVVTRVPAIWHPSMELHARMFYANEALGLTEQLHWPIFQAMNEDGKRFASEDEVLDWVADQGVDAEAYRRALNSFGVTSQVGQVQTKMAQYRVRGTPEMVINGKYHLTTTMAKTQENMLVIGKALVAKELAASAN